MESTTKPKRPVFQPYIPVHRRNKAPVEVPIVSTPSPRPSPKEEPELKRRGRGQFRAPLTEDLVIVNSTEPKTPKTDNPVFDLIKKVEKLATGPNKQEEPDDWEEEWEETIDVVVKKATPEPPKKVNTILPEDDDLTTVLDCYDFPNAFKTHHLQDIFKEYESIRGGYTIKWMDDTRALIVFEHPATAKKAYIDNLNSPFIKIRPYKGHIDKKPSGPVPRRPVTTDMVARRLVHGALGVKSSKTAEQRQVEKELLKQAREQRHSQKANAVNREKDISKAFEE
ncbi:hypothetical protein EDC94DRAFT_626893 [Helicostylum pulchrum]|nr:hypothetical protein EDC94DRAFT_626893 [Helicostylum pulchrum]